MKKKLIIIGLAMLGYLGIAHAQTSITKVSAVTVWTDTGIYLTNSEWVDINAFGPWFWDTTAFTTEPDSIIDLPDIADTWVKNGLVGSLIAYVGPDPFAGSGWEAGTYLTNQYLEVGTARQFMSTTNGELWLGENGDASGPGIGGSGGTNDNGGLPVIAAVSLGFCDSARSNLIVSVVQVSSNLFEFSFSNGIPHTSCAIYDSADLKHWTLLDTLVMGTNGSSLNAVETGQPFPGCGFANGVFTNITAVPYRFYKVSNGPLWSQPIGFERMTVSKYWAIIADQLLAQTNTLNGLFGPMADGSTLPNGTQIAKWRLGGGGFDNYTYSSGSWSPNGNATLYPGEAAFLIPPTNVDSVTVMFAGLVEIGNLTNYPIAVGDTYISSMIPQAGGVQSLGYRPNPAGGDNVFFWVGTSVNISGYIGFTYEGAGLGTGLGFQSDWTDGNSFPPNPPTIPGEQLDTVNGVYWAPDPVVNVGQGFYIQNAYTNTEYWPRKFPGCCDQ